MDVMSDDLLDHISHIARTRRGALAAAARAEGLTAEDAIDAVQDALATLLVMPTESLPREASEWEPFVATLVRNAARNKRRRHFLSRPHDPLESHVIVDSASEVEAAIVRAEEHVRLRGCVAELCDTQRAVVALRMLEERPGEEVATTLGISPAYVATLLYRAKAALSSCMAEGH